MIIKLQANIKLPDNVTDEEITAYLEFELGINGSISTGILDKFKGLSEETLSLDWRRA